MAINLLDQSTINKIAAGEVVERPASVVKELVENSIDAGAKAITVEIKDGGISFIRITDNGSGIEPSEVKLAFKRHSTSKIKTAADLAGISSLGFRGEALSSISAVAQVELITKTKESLLGVRYVIDGGVEKTFEEIGAPNGTTFVIRNLFYNTPARRKFLKTPATEGSYISSVVEHLCMSHPDISFRFIVNGQPKIQTAGNNNLKDVIYTIFGREITANLIETDETFENFRIKGYIGKPVVCRGNRNYENYYINGRYIKSGIISKAVEEAYAPFIMQHKYPFTAFHIEINPESLDVNVHPQKMELRFSNGSYVYDSVKKAVTNALTRKELIPEIEVTVEKKTTEVKQTPSYVFVQEKKSEPEKPVRLPEPFETLRSVNYTEKVNNTFEQLEIFERPKLLEEENKKDIKIIGQVFDTYWIIQFENNMYIIDQHAAHEKVLFEQFMKKYKENRTATQYISPPVVFSVTAGEDKVLTENINIFTEMGYEIASFGGDEYAISGIPADFTMADPKALLLEILDDISEEGKKDTPESIKNKIATMSCKAAVKGNNRLSYSEAKKLVEELMELENPYNCPHGRPTMITMSKYELEKKFSRIV